MHNPRAEAARAEGCSFERFFDIMKEDDAFDAPLTELGKDQAQKGEARFGKYLRDAELLVASPLSRALQTHRFHLNPPLTCFKNTQGSLLPANLAARWPCPA